MMEPYPLLLERRLSRRLWGGARLAAYLGIDDEMGPEPLAESWQVYEGNGVLNGAFAGRSLRQVAEEMGAWLLGTASLARYGSKVPLLAKFIDAAKPLSIQVHPDDEYALRKEAASGHLGKAEAWYILDATPEARVIWGFARDMTEQSVREAVEAGELERYVNEIPVSAGDVIYNPEGTVHAIGAGIFLFEIQQASDLTYRLYDYGRKDSTGSERELHLEQAIEVANFEAGDLAKVAPLELGGGRQLLVEGKHFGMESVETAGSVRLATSPASFDLLTVTRGRAVLDYGNGSVELEKGTSAVLPAALGEYSLGGHAQVLRCYVPVI